MANNWQLGMIAGLDGTQSRNQLNSDIKGLSRHLDKLKLYTEIDKNQVIQLQNQLKKLQIDLNTVTVTDAAINGLVQKINAGLQNIQINNINVGNISSQAQQAGQQIGKLISDSAEQAISNVSSKNIGRYFRIDSSTSNQFRTEMEKLVSEWTNAKGKLTDLNIQTRTSYDKDADANITRLHQATVTYKNELDEVIKKTIAWRQIGTTTNAKGEEEILRGFVEVAGQYSKSLDTATVKTDNFAKKQKETVANLQNTINQITSRAFDSNASKPITSDTSLNKLNTQVANVENAMNNLRNATSTTFDDAKIKVQEEISQLKILEKELRNADNVSTKMKGTDITSGISIAKNDLEKFKADAKDFPQITQTIKDLDTAISKVGDASSLNSFNDNLRVARSELAKIKLETSANNRNEKVGINISGLQSKIADLQKISPEIDKFETEINGAKVTVQSLLTDLSKINTQSDFSVVNAKFSAFTKAAEASGIAIRDFGNVTDSIAKRADEIQLSTDVTKLTTDYQKFGVVSQQVENNLKELRLAQEAVVNAKGTDRLATEIEKYDTALEKAKSSWKELSVTQVSLSQRTSQMTSMQEWMRKNSAATKLCGDRVRELIAECQTCNKVRFDQIKNEFKQIQVEAGKAGKLGNSFLAGLKDQAKSFTQWISVSGAVMKGINAFRKATNNVIDLDTKMVELSKVSDLTAQGLEDVTNKCYDLGEGLSKTGTDVLDAVTTFKRAGYDIADSMIYAEEALKTANISENLKDASENASSLVNIMKGFQNETPEFAKKINDAVNQVSNTEAVNFDNLIDGATRLSAVADQAGLSFEQMLGTLTGGYEILGNMEKVATGQITIFSRLQAIQLDGEEEVSTVAKLQEKFSNATKGAVNIVDQTSGQLRNVYDILDDLAGVWDTLDKNTREALAIEAAGIRQKQVFLALMQNWKGVEDAVESAKNSLGSADEENKKYINSIQGKLENLESATQKLSKTLIDSDLVKFFVDLGTTGVKAIDGLVNALGGLGTIGLLGGAGLGIKNIGRPKMFGLIV